MATKIPKAPFYRGMFPLVGMDRSSLGLSGYGREPQGRAEGKTTGIDGTVGLKLL